MANNFPFVQKAPSTQFEETPVTNYNFFRHSYVWLILIDELCQIVEEQLRFSLVLTAMSIC